MNAAPERRAPSSISPTRPLPVLRTGQLIGRTRGTAPLPRVHWPSASNDQDDPACVVRVTRRPVISVVSPVLSVPAPVLSAVSPVSSVVSPALSVVAPALSVLAPPSPSLGAKPLVAERFSSEMMMPDLTPEPEADTPASLPRRRRVMFGAAIATISTVALAAGLLF